MVLASPHYQHTCKTRKGMKIEGCCVSHAGITQNSTVKNMNPY